MLNIDAAAVALLKAGGTDNQISISLYNSDGTLAATIDNTLLNTESFKLREALCSGPELTFGDCYSSELYFECADTAALTPGGRLVAKLTVSGEYEIPLGTYYVAGVSKKVDRRMRKVTAYDSMLLLDRDVSGWYAGLWSGGATAITLKAMRDSLCAYVGIAQETVTLIHDTLAIAHTIDPAEISGREVLRAICEINGVFGRISRAGALRYVSLSATPVDSIPTGARRSLDYSDYTVQGIDALNIRQEDNDIGASVGSGSNAYVVQGNFLVYGKSAEQLAAISTALFAKIGGITYRPAKLSCNALPYLECGDRITAADGIETLVMERVIKGICAMTDAITATGEQTRGETYGVNKNIIQLLGRTNSLARTVDETVSTVADLSTGYTTLTQRVSGITLSAVSKAGYDAAIRLTNGGNASEVGIKLSVSNNTDYSTIQLSVSGVTISSKTIRFTGDVIFASNLTDGTTTISGSNITTGTISGASLRLGGTDYGAADIYDGDDVRMLGLGEYGLTFYSNSNGNSVIGRLNVNADNNVYLYGANGIKLISDRNMSIDVGNAGYTSYKTLYICASAGALGQGCTIGNYNYRNNASYRTTVELYGNIILSGTVTINGVSY